MRHQLTTRNRGSAWDLFKEFDEMINQLQGATPSERTELFQPATDITENDKGYLMAFDLPGMKEKDVKIEVHDGMLTVTGERRREFQDEKNGWTRTERSFGRFHRAFSLPKDVDPSRIEAQFDNGELQLYLPKSEAAKPVSIEVKTGAGKETGEVKGLMERFFGPKEKNVEGSTKH
ncbi:MAG: Hsp20/alpha crystallin family protein [Bdellovibrionaceae bacterium]|nr:Hsp20/alpha crystallin family protein [Pseudobdellovibrionaceae bacterium]MBX3034994.1 Hsp20/alpha crystallin family protein [Pseudobdellovibrionaceae bacterium]